MIELRRRYSGGVQSPSFSRLPKEYQEVEWILMPKGGYISSGVNAKGSTRVYTKFAIHELTPSWLFGSRKGLSEDNFGVLNQTADNALRVAYGTNSQQQSIPNAITDNNIHIIDLNKGYCYFDGGLISSYSQQDFEGLNILIGAFNNNNVINATTSHYFYEFCIWDNDVMIRNLIPCYRISDRKPGMYDIVNDVFYTNAGEGEFSYGPDVYYNIPPEYQQVEYLDNQQNPMAYLVIPQIKIGFNGKIIGKVSVPSNSVQLSNFPYKMAFGWNNGPQATAVLSGSKMYWGNFNTSGYLIEIDKLYELTLEINNNNSTLYVDNVLSASNSTFNNNDSLYIFNGHTLNLSFLGKVYSIKTEGTENIHLIPCYRKADNVAGMYDLVSGEFYTNAGTGKFEVGPDVLY